MHLVLFPVDELLAEGIDRPTKLHSRLYLQTDDTTWPQLNPGNRPDCLDTFRVPQGFFGYFQPDGYNEVTLSRFDARGECRYMLAGELKKLRVAHIGFNLAVMAYIAALPDDTYVVLYWQQGPRDTSQLPMRQLTSSELDERIRAVKALRQELGLEGEQDTEPDEVEPERIVLTPEERARVEAQLDILDSMCRGAPDHPPQG